MKKTTISRARLALATLLTLPALAQASVVFDGFGPGDAFDQPRFVSVANDDVVINGQLVGQDRDWAFGFTVGESATLDTLEIALSSAGGEDSVEIFLRDSSGGLPGGVIESWLITGGLIAEGSIQTLSSVFNPLLAAGSSYWIEMSAGSGGSDLSRVGWHTSGGPSSLLADQLDEGAWALSSSSSLAYRVNGTLASVPAPATSLLVVLGLVALRTSRRPVG